MKAVERKELQGNSLKQFGKDLMHGGKRVPTLVWVLPLLVVTVWVIYYFWSGVVAARTTNFWAIFWAGRDGGRDKEIEEKLKGSVAELAWRLEKNDRLYNTACDRLGTAPTKAAEDLKTASQEYEAISKAGNTSPLMAMIALSGAAKCEEVLGEIERAQYFYKSVMDRFGNDADWKEHPLVLEAQKNHARLGKTTDERRVFDERWLKDLLQMVRERPPERPKEPDPLEMPPLTGVPR
jgi:hypothetical protein